MGGDEEAQVLRHYRAALLYCCIPHSSGTAENTTLASPTFARKLALPRSCYRDG